MKHPVMFTVALALLCLAPSCRAPGQKADEAAQREALLLLMPRTVEIVKPFTRVRSFDSDELPDGIELLVRAVNALDNPGLMIVGNIRVELYEYVPASGDNKGRQLDRWDIELITAEQQRTYWNQLTQMYEFRLKINPEQVPRAEKYVLLVTYASPLGEYLTDQLVLTYSAATGTFSGVTGKLRGA